LWSIGVIAYELITGILPFDGNNLTEVKKKIIAGIYEFPEKVKVSNGLKDFIKTLLQTKASKRPSWDRLQDHPFLSQGERVNIITLGGLYAGKTSLIRRFGENKFCTNMSSTVGFEQQIKELIVKKRNYKLILYDTCAQERYASITQNYFKYADIILLVYDISQRESFEKVQTWAESVENSVSLPNSNKILVGTKCDLEEKRQVGIVEGQELALQYGVQFFEVSALTGQNVEFMFRKIIRNMRKTKIEEKSFILPKKLSKVKTRRHGSNCSCPSS
jgi:small GTP-binding protein